MSRIVIMLALLLAGAPANGHDHWIRNGKYMDPVTGLHCCSEHDCLPLTPDDMITVVTHHGGDMTVNGIRFKPGQQHKSEDGKWYRCAHRCLFKPVEG